MMIFTQVLNSVVQYIAEGFARIFSPSDDQYPLIGLQPFGGEIYSPTSYDW
jgi:hypothetical protein